MATQVRHCVVEAFPVGVTPPGSGLAPRCFDSFADAISYATDGSVRLLAGSTTVTQDQLDAGRQANRVASTVIGIEYEDTGFGGDDWIVNVASGCNDGGVEVWQNSDLAGNVWNNRISSALTYGGCKSRHFENANFSGAQYLCGCSQMVTIQVLPV